MNSSENSNISRLDHRVVAHVDRVDQQPSHAGPVEHDFDDDRAAEQEAELQAHHRDDRDQRIAQAVLDDDRALGQALRARRADVVLLQDVDERRTRESRHDRGDRRAERQRGQDVVPPAVGADRRQPVQLHGEDLHQHHAERERRKRNAGDRQRHAQPVRPAIAPDRRDDADRHAEDDRPRHRGDRQPERRHESLADLDADGTLGAQRSAEVAVHDAGDEAQELLRQRLVEAQILAHQRDRFRRRVGAGGKARRIAGQQMDEQEGQRADQQQRRDQPEQALDDVLEHRFAARGPGEACAKPVAAAVARRHRRVQGFRSTSVKLNDASGIT